MAQPKTCPAWPWCRLVDGTIITDPTLWIHGLLDWSRRTEMRLNGSEYCTVFQNDCHPLSHNKRDSQATPGKSQRPTDTVLETVIAFIPVPKYSDDCRGRPDTVFGEDPLFPTIVPLCRAFPALGRRLGPQNEGFWRSMVLQRFDCTVDEQDQFNVEDYDQEWTLRGPTDRKHPIRQAIRKYKATHPDYDNGDEPKMMEHDLAYWSSIGGHFRPAEYAFLAEIQQGRASISAWPQREDAYTLYRDLALLQDKLSKLEDLLTWPDGESNVYPCLLSRTDGEVVDDGLEQFKHCEFLPFCWDRSMHKTWSGLRDPLSPSVLEIDQSDEWSLQMGEEKSIFPQTLHNRHRFECLRRVVHESFSDWRRLHADAEGGEYPSVEFYTGKSKASGRWLGFVGESQYYCTCNPRDDSLSTGCRMFLRDAIRPTEATKPRYDLVRK